MTAIKILMKLQKLTQKTQRNCASTFLTKKYCPVKLDTTWTKIDKTPASIFFVFYHQRLFLDKQEPHISNQDWRSGNFRINISDHGLKVTAFPPPPLKLEFGKYVILMW